MTHPLVLIKTFGWNFKNMYLYTENLKCRIMRIVTLLFCFMIAAIAPAQDEVWWSYYPQDVTTAFATGDGVAQTYHAAIRLPANYAMPEDGQLLGIRFKLSTKRVSDVKAWVATELPVGSEGDLLTCDVPADSYSEDIKMYEQRFSQPVSVPADGCYIGISFTVPEISSNSGQAVYDQNPLCYVQEEVPSKDAFYIRSDKFPYWENYGVSGKSLILQVLIGGTLFENAVMSMDFGTHQAVHGETVNVPITLKNLGTATVSSIDYAIDTRTRKGQEVHFDLPDPIVGLGTRAVVELPFATDTYTGNVKKTLRIIKVNGQANETTSQSTGALFELTRRVVPRLLFEEYTGMWCVNCPRGMVGLDMLTEDCGDRIVGMAIHNGDPLALTDYDFTGSLIKGYPSSLINREYELDPYYGTTYSEPYHVKDDVEWVLQNTLALAELDVQANWNSDYTGIDVETTTTFLYDSNSANFAIGYVLVADDLYNETWRQKNGYAGSTSVTDPNLLPWTELPQYVTGLHFNHVAIATWGAQKGLSGSVKAPLQAETPQTHTHYIDISQNKLVQNKGKLKVAALLFDTQTGKVINARQVALPYDAPTGIEAPDAIASQQQPSPIYDVLGRRITRPNGIYLQRGADGKMKKYFSKQ